MEISLKNTKKNVPRLLPRLSSYKAAITQPAFNMKAGLRSEKRTFQAIGFVTITIFLLWFIGRF